MQILELLGSTASTAKVPQADLSSQKDAFVRHLDEVMSHREDMRGEDARLHASRQDNKDDPTARDDEPVDRADTRDERAPETEARDDTSSARESTAPAEKSAADETVVAPAEADVAKVLSGAMAQQDNSPDTLAAASGEEAVIGKAADDALLSENDQTVVPQEALNKASVNAAFNGNDKARAGNHVSDKAGPFDAAANIDAGDQAIASGAESGATVKDLPEFASEVAARTDMADLSDETQVASQVATQSNTQQVKAPGAETADARAAEAKASTRQADPVMAETPLIKDGAIAVGPDARLNEMKIAQALVEEAAAEKVHARFMIGANTANNTTIINQLAAAQGSGALESGQTAGKSAGLQTGQNNQPMQPAANDGNGSAQVGQLAARTEAAPVTPAQVAQPVPGQNGLTNMDPTAQASMSERAANTLAQMTAQANQGQNTTRPSQAAIPTAAAGAEVAANSLSGTSTAATPVTAIGEVGAPTATQMANAAKPAAPPAPPTPQQPQTQVALHIAKAVQNGTDKISIRLNPAELGRVDIKLEVSRDGAVTASVTVERPETLELLKGDARSLERALANAGLDPDKDNLSFNLRDQNNSNSFANNADGDGNRSANGEDSSKTAQAEDEDLDVEALLAEARNSATSDRALDINV